VTTSSNGDVDEEANCPPKVYLLSEDGVVASVVAPGTQSIWQPADAGAVAWNCSDGVQLEWSPWTRRQVRKQEEDLKFSKENLWCWATDENGWWIAFHFLIGSILFMVGGFASVFVHVESDPAKRRMMHLMMYALGAVEFTLGGTLLIYDTIYSKLRFVYDDEIAQNLQTTGDSIAEVHVTTPGFDPTPSEEVVYQHNRSTNFMGAWKIRRAVGESPVSTGQLDVNQPLLDQSGGPWPATAAQQYEASVMEGYMGIQMKPAWVKRRYWLDLVGAYILYFGVNCYNVMLLAELTQSFRPDLRVSEAMELWTVTYPCVCGGACFVIAGYLYWISSNRSGNPFIWKPKSMQYWIALTNMLGSVGYFIGGASTHPFVRGQLASFFVGTAPQLFVGYVLGSIAYGIQSYLMILEIALVS